MEKFFPFIVRVSTDNSKIQGTLDSLKNLISTMFSKLFSIKKQFLIKKIDILFLFRKIITFTKYALQSAILKILKNKHFRNIISIIELLTKFEPIRPVICW